MHLKRHEVPKKWPIARKGSVYIARPNSNLNGGIPLLVVLRDILKIAQTKKEVKEAIHSKNILVNAKRASDEKQAILLFDTVTNIPAKKNYRLEIAENGKFYMKEISEKESWKKIAKILDKKVQKKKKMQINLSDGRNFISDMKCGINDSILIDLKNKNAEKCIPLAENTNAVVFEGKHTGKFGKIKKINAGHKTAEIDVRGKSVNVLLKQIIVTE